MQGSYAELGKRLELLPVFPGGTEDPSKAFYKEELKQMKKIRKVLRVVEL